MAALAQAACLFGELVALRLVASGLDGVEDGDGETEALGGGRGGAVEGGEGGEPVGVAVERAAAGVEFARELVEEVVGHVGGTEGAVRATGDARRVAAGADGGLTAG
jgi:hypothetical protein